jgi:RNA polymerase sigma factor (sigma-70 family)
MRRPAGGLAMNAEEQRRLNDINTSWTDVRSAVGGGPDAAVAQAELFRRYGGAMRRYLQVAVADTAAVDDLLQEFAVALASGSFQGVRPERGRFRDYIKGVMFRMVRKHRRDLQRRPSELGDIDLTDPDNFAEACEAQFRQSWRDELLARTWEDLAHDNAEYFTVLHFRASYPDMAAQQMLAELEPQLGRPLSPEGVRQTLHRARKRYVHLLHVRVAGALELPTPDAIQEELCDLELASFILKPART